MAVELDGPRLAPRSGSARQLVVFLHGYGADGNDLIEIGRVWQPFLPRRRLRVAACAGAVRAGAGRAAMVRADLSRSERALGRRQQGGAGAGALSSMPNSRRLNLPPSALALVGFSQGTMMALHVGLRRAVPPAAIVGYSGLLVLPPDGDPEPSPPRSDRARRCCWCMAMQDELIPAQALFQATQGLAGAGRAGRMAYVRRRRPRHRPRGPAPRRRIPRAAFRAVAIWLPKLRRCRRCHPACQPSPNRWPHRRSWPSKPWADA